MLVDLSHTIEHGMITYAGLPPPAISDFLSREASRSRYAAGTEFHIGRIDMVANTGTYLDTPSHRFADGSDVSMVPLDAVAGIPALLLRAKGRSIDANAIEGHDVRGKALLIHTGWSQHWRPELVETLHGRGVRLVGIDSYNIDDTADQSRPAHTLLLGAGIYIVEHLTNLESLPDLGPIHFFAVPAKVRGLGTFPVRAFAMV